MSSRIFLRTIVMGWISLVSCLLVGASEPLLRVEIDGIPSGYSVAYGGFAPILDHRNSLRLTSFKRLRFGARSDEIAMAIKTGNSPDVLSLTASEYDDLVDAGSILDLSSYLLKRDIGNDGFSTLAAWSPLQEAGEELTSLLLRKGRVYAFPGRRRVHGVVIRRDLVDGSESFDDLDSLLIAKIAARLSLKMPAGASYSGIAIPLDSDRLLYWSISDYGRSLERLPAGAETNTAALCGMAVAGMQNVYSSMTSLLHESTVVCDGCGWVGFAAEGAAAYAVCETCEQEGAALRVLNPVGRLVGSAEEGMALFAEGSVGMVACTRSDLITLVDAGMSPRDILFVPLAGAAYVPDVERLALYSRVPERAGGERRVKELIHVLKLYSSQFLTPPSSELYLWYERNVVSALLRRGYAGFYAPAEVSACMELPGWGGAESYVTDGMLVFGQMLGVPEFLEMCGLESVAEVDGVVSRLKHGALPGSGYLRAVEQLRATRPGRIVSSVVVLGVIAGLLAALYLLFFNGMRRSAEGEGTASRPHWLGAIFALVLVVFLLLKMALPSLSSAVVMSGLISGGSGSSAELVEVVVALLAVTGITLFSALVTIAVGVGVALLISLLLNRIDGWPVFMSFLMVLPISLMGFWGYMLLDAVSRWGMGILGGGQLDSGDLLFAARVCAVVWGTMPFACMAYLYRLRRIDEEGGEALSIDGGGVQERFFVVLLPCLAPAIKMHALILATLAICGTAPALLGAVDCAVGGQLLRALLFSEEPWLVAAMNAGALLAALLVAVVGVRWFRTLELRSTYPGSKI